MQNKNAIVWSINPYQKRDKLWRRSQELALQASKAFRVSLCPVFIADPLDIIRLSNQSNDRVKEYVDESREKLRRLLEKQAGSSIASRHLIKPEVLFAREVDQVKEAISLGRYASLHRAPLILAATSARRGLARFLEGSFAEAIVGKSPVPVLLVNPTGPAIRPLKTIIFATDFSPESMKAFKKLLGQALQMRAAVEIYSLYSAPPVWTDTSFPQAARVSMSLIQAGLESSCREAIRKGNVMLAMARKKQLRAKLSVERLDGSVARNVLNRAKEIKADLIALSARGDTNKSHLFGTTSQVVIRTSPLPVWIYRSSLHPMKR